MLEYTQLESGKYQIFKNENLLLECDNIIDNKKTLTVINGDEYSIFRRKTGKLISSYNSKVIFANQSIIINDGFLISIKDDRPLKLMGELKSCFKYKNYIVAAKNKAIKIFKDSKQVNRTFEKISRESDYIIGKSNEFSYLLNLDFKTIFRFKGDLTIQEGYVIGKRDGKSYLYTTEGKLITVSTGFTFKSTHIMVGEEENKNIIVDNKLLFKGDLDIQKHSSGLFRVKNLKTNTLFLYDLKSKKRSKTFKALQHYSHGTYRVMNVKGKLALFNNFKITTNFIYDEIKICENILTAKKGGIYKVFSIKNGEEISNNKYSSIKRYKNYVIARYGNKVDIFSDKLERTLESNEATILEFNEVYYLQNRVGDTYQLLNNFEKLSEYDQLVECTQYLGIVKKEDKYKILIGGALEEESFDKYSIYRNLVKFDTETSSVVYYKNYRIYKGELLTRTDNPNLTEFSCGEDTYIHRGRELLKNAAICEGCEDLTEDLNEVNGMNVCRYCYSNRTSTCTFCDQLTLNRQGQDLRNGWCCNNCLDENTFSCDDCGYSISNSEESELESICTSCFGNYSECGTCGQFDREVGVYGNCSTCESLKLSSKIRSYSFRPKPKFFGEDLDNLYFGIELEVDDVSNNCEELTDVTSAIKENFYYYKWDGSLENGFEIVTHPMSVDFASDYDWNTKLETINSYGLTSQNNDTSGLHIHVSRKGMGSNKTEIDETISKVLFLHERFKNEIIQFSRRGGENSYARFYTLMHGDTPKKLLEKAKSGERYSIINLEPNHTIEFRGFKGTLNGDHLKAAIQFTYEIIQFARLSTEDEVAKISWEDMIETFNLRPELENYLQERDLMSECSEEFELYNENSSSYSSF